MNGSQDAPNLAIFCDFENVAIGVRSARYEAFDIDLVLERLLDKGKIVVKKAYSDWGRYKSARRPLHEAGFELIEIPHVSYSGKNSADIRMVVDALDLCYTKEHVHVFVIVSGDSDFSPLVSKLRENNKKVIALGVKNSSSDLLIENCDEFIYYDDLVREHAKSKSASKKKKPHRRASAGEGGDEGNSAGGRAAREEREPAKEKPPKKERSVEERKQEALELVLDTVDSLFRDRDDNLWGSMVKQTLQRKRPHFNETFHGYRNFTQLLLDAQKRGLLEIQKDERSGGYIILGFGPSA
ncbi:MAG: NYN domain-containing protein [Bradymonadia bacterium]